MDVKLYGKKGCKLCAGAEEKLVLMKIPYEKFDIEYHSAPHDGWREDGSVEVQALHCLIDMQIPMVVINGKPYAYAQAMRTLKALKRNA